MNSSLVDNALVTIASRALQRGPLWIHGEVLLHTALHTADAPLHPISSADQLLASRCSIFACQVCCPPDLQLALQCLGRARTLEQYVRTGADPAGAIAFASPHLHFYLDLTRRRATPDDIGLALAAQALHASSAAARNDAHLPDEVLVRAISLAPMTPAAARQVALASPLDANDPDGLRLITTALYEDIAQHHHDADRPAPEHVVLDAPLTPEQHHLLVSTHDAAQPLAAQLHAIQAATR